MPSANLTEPRIDVVVACRNAGIARATFAPGRAISYLVVPCSVKSLELDTIETILRHILERTFDRPPLWLTVAAIVFSILPRVAALTSLLPLGAFRAALVLIAAEAISRAAMVRLWQELPAARLAGLAHETGPPDQQAMVVATVTGLALAIILVWPAIGFLAAILAILLAVVATYILTRLSYREIGGRTGDTLGGCQQIAAVAFLVGAAAG
jgi:hypothetical protein